MSRNLSWLLWSGFGKSVATDKSKDEERIPEVAGSDAGSGTPELATARNTGR